MECEKQVKSVIETTLTTISGAKVVARQRQLTMGEIWAAEEMAGVRAGHFDLPKLRAYFSKVGKDNYTALTDEERVELFNSDAWVRGDDGTTPAGRKQLLYQLAFSLGLKVNGRGAGNVGLDEGIKGVEATADNLPDIFGETGFAKLIENLSRLSTLTEAEAKN